MTLRLSTLCALLLTIPAMADWIEFTSPSTNFTVCYCTNLSAPDWEPWLFGNGEITVASTTIDALNPRRVICPCQSWSVDVVWETAPYGYCFYLGGVSGVYTNSMNTGTNGHFVVSDLVENTTYYLAATTYNADGIGSPFSAEMVLLPPACPIYSTICIFFQAGTNKLAINKVKG